MKNFKFVLAVAGLLATASHQFVWAGMGDVKTVGRVKVTTLHASPSEAVRSALSTRLAPAAGKRFAENRVVSVRPRAGDAQRFDATIYDYTVEKAFDIVVDAKGREISRKQIDGQPARPLEELAEAYAVVRAHTEFKAALAAGTLELYEPMPPITVDAEGRRLVNVGVSSNVVEGHMVDMNEVVSVHIPTAKVVRYPSGAPETSRASLLACGPSGSGCSASTGTCSFYQVSWPAVNPVWNLKVRHPSCTNDIQGDGTGLEITDVFYQGRLILKRGEVPVLNVLYENNTCGPYRDWLDSEDCFQANGTDVGSGIRVASTPPTTLCESGNPGSDAGNFRGVAIYDAGSSLLLMTETTAGWYRYVMEWRLYLDGTIEPIFGFGATLNSCTCNPHYHHAYWRMEWAIDGNVGDTTSGITTLERLRPGTVDDYDPITNEGTFLRPAVDPEKDYFRIKNPLTGNGYVLHPGHADGTANGDAYAKWDFAALAYSTAQIDDPNSNTSINLGSWNNAEPLGTKRLVTWYHATYDHDDPGGTGEPCELAGPKFVPVVPCAGSITIDRATYACSSSISITANDSDLSGSGTLNVAVTSGSETAPETISLTESPAGSGHFLGAVATIAGPAVNGDGKISVAHGDALNVQYVDASACGTPNVPVTKTATVDCQVPTIANVQVVPGAGTAALTWTTSESANGVAHYGTTVPPAGSATATGTSTHAATLTGLSDCTTYYYWVESADAAGNVAASNAGGGYFAFTTGQTGHGIYASSGAPIPIPDNNTTGVTSTIVVSGGAVVQDVNVTVNVTHTYDDDLTLSLLPPVGAPITLSNRRGGSQNNYTNTVFNDEATTPIGSGAPPFTGSFRPETVLSAADGQSANGSWRFKVVDQIGQDVGTIDSWSLDITYPTQTCTPPGPPPPVPDGAFGAGMTASRVTALVESIHLNWDATTCPATNNHLLYGSLGSLSSYTLSGAVCGLGPVGSFDWNNPPADDLWFVVVGDDAAAREGSWGNDSVGAPRGGTTASAQCGFTTRDNGGTCQ